jgi:hypothetical protein
VRGFDVSRVRPQLFAATILWVVLSVIGFASVALGG